MGDPSGILFVAAWAVLAVVLLVGAYRRGNGDGPSRARCADPAPTVSGAAGRSEARARPRPLVRP